MTHTNPDDSEAKARFIFRSRCDLVLSEVYTMHGYQLPEYRIVAIEGLLAAYDEAVRIREAKHE